MSKNKKISLSFACAVFLALILALGGATTLTAQSPEEELEREAQAIDRMIMCPVCPAETIDQAQVEISFQMRAVIREMLTEGRTREEILDYFVDRYGPDILAAPPKSGVNLLAWILPIVGVALALGALYLIVRAMTGRGQPTVAAVSGSPVEASGESHPEQAEEAQPDDPELSPYLAIVDRTIASRRGGRPHPGPPPEGEGVSGG